MHCPNLTKMLSHFLYVRVTYLSNIMDTVFCCIEASIKIRNLMKMCAHVQMAINWYSVSLDACVPVFQIVNSPYSSGTS